MNTLHFKYAVEVEKTGSITKAAENLFMAQPNLSKAIRELEENLGITLFRRTSKGVAPTAKGAEFLVYAKKILAQLERMEALKSPTGEDRQHFSLCLPNGGYTSHAFTKFAATLLPQSEMDVRVKETTATDAIQLVAGGSFNLGIVRIPAGHFSYFEELLKARDLLCQPIWEYEPVLLMGEEHPLAYTPHLTADLLEPYTRLYREEALAPGVSGEAVSPRKITFFGGGNVWNLLCQMPTCYLWSSPVPEEMLSARGVVQRRCGQKNGLLRDVLIYPSDYTLTPLDRQFVDALFVTKNQVAFQEYR